MKASIALALAAAQLAASHATFQSMIVDGKDQGHHTGVRTPSNANNPILEVGSTAMICNGGSKAADTVEVKAGSELTFQWHHNDPSSDGDKDDPIAESHRGPIMVYVAPAASNGEGDVWVKIAEEGLSGGKWAVDTFRANKGKHSVTLPDLADGEYLIRPEIIALHEGNRAKGAQFYNGCGQIKVTGGKTTLPAGVDMTKAYKADDKGVLFDIYSGATTYPIPGPKVWDGASSGAAPATPATSAKPTPTAAAPSATATAVESAAPAPAKPVASAAPQTGSGSALPEQFTIAEFIAWLKQTTGADSKARRHARAFF
jgi:cellulase